MIGKAEKVIKFKHKPDNMLAYPIVPASKVLPEWYKKLGMRYPGEKPFVAPTVKACMPFFDAMVQGYVIPLWADLYVSTGINEEGNPFPTFTWAEYGEVIIGSHELKQTIGAPVMEKSLGGGPAFKFISPWIIETPKGYSTLFVSPLNNVNPNFEMVSAIVSTDYYKQFINFPFVWTGPADWEGTIPQGTPLVQVIPFKRDDFRHEINGITAAEENLIRSGTKALACCFQNAYKRLWRKTSKSR